MIECHFTSAAGDVVVSIDAGDTTREAQIYGIAGISYKFDLTPGQAQIDSLIAMYQGSTIDIDRYDEQSFDLYDLIRGAAPCTVAMVITTFTREIFEFNFKFELGDISTDEESNQLKIRLKATFNEGLTAGEVFDAAPGQIQFVRDALITEFGTAPQTLIQPYTCVGVASWLETALKLLFKDNPTLVRAGLSELGSGYTTELFGPLPDVGARGFVMVDFPDLNFGSTGEGRTLLVGDGSVTTSIEGEDFQNGVEVYIIRLTGVGTSFLSQVAVGDEINAVFYMGQVIARDSDTVMYTMLAKTLYTAVTARPYQVYSTPRPRQIPALDVLKSLSGIEGSFFGSGFSQNFYINRLRRSPDDRVYLPWNGSVEKCEPVYQNSYLGASFVSNIIDGRKKGTEEFGSWPAPVSTTNRRLPNLLPSTATVPGNRNADQSLEVSLAPGYPFLSKGLRATEQVQGDYTGSEEDDLLEQSLTQIGIQSHYKALTGAGDQLMIKFTYLSAFALKPWQTFVFIDPPARYANKEFRITEISYDIVANVFTARAYQIDTVSPITVPDRITNLGLNFQFGNKMLPPGLVAPVNNILADGLQLIATFVTAAAVGGELREIPIIRAAGDTTVIPQAYKITLVNPALISQRIELEVDETLDADGTTLLVFPVDYPGTFPAGSFVYISNRSMLTGILTGEFGINMFSNTFGVGVLTQPVNGLVTEVPVDLFTSVPRGRSLFIIDILRNVSVNIQTTGAAGGGPGTMAIEEQLINMPAGALVYSDGAHLQALFQMDPGHIHLKVIREEKENSIGEIATGHAAGIINQLDCIINRSNSLAQGQLLRVSNEDGSGETFVVPEDMELIAFETIVIPVVEKTTTIDLLGGATVYEPAAEQSSRITLVANRVDVVVEDISEINYDVAFLTLAVGDAIDDIDDLIVLTDELDIDLGVIGARAVLGVLSGNNVARFDLLTGETSGNAILEVTNNFIIRTAGANTIINADGLNFIQKLSSGGTEETDVRRMVTWVDKTSPTTESFRSALVSYADTTTGGTGGKSVDVTGFDTDQFVRFVVRRNLTGVEDFIVGVAADDDQFVTGMEAGDAVIQVTNGNLWLNESIRVTGGTILYGSLAVNSVAAFQDIVTVQTDVSGATRALNRAAGDGRYGQLISTNNFTGQNSFTGDIIVSDATAGTHAMNRQSSDLRYGRLNSNNPWTGTQDFQNAITSTILTVLNQLNVGTLYGSSGLSFRSDGFNERLKIYNGIFMYSLPTEAPAGSKQLWNDAGTIKITA